MYERPFTTKVTGIEISGFTVDSVIVLVSQDIDVSLFLCKSSMSMLEA